MTCGTTNLVDVCEYAEPVAAKGRVFMDTPGHDPVSATGQVAGGANLICFTTGRGSACGCAPSLKLSTNTALWARQEEGIGINCGEVIDGTPSIDETGERIFRPMLETASGRATKSELHGDGQSEFVPWQRGRRCSVALATARMPRRLRSRCESVGPGLGRFPQFAGS